MYGFARRRFRLTCAIIFVNVISSAVRVFNMVAQISRRDRLDFGIQKCPWQSEFVFFARNSRISVMKFDFFRRKVEMMLGPVVYYAMRQHEVDALRDRKELAWTAYVAKTGSGVFRVPRPVVRNGCCETWVPVRHQKKALSR
jgi:hypothetical protein